MPENPDWKKEVRTRLAEVDLAPAREAEIVDELADHLAEEYRMLLNSGATPIEAVEIALDGFDEKKPLSEGLRRVERSLPRDPVILGAANTRSRMADLWRDLRYAFRALRRSPGFTALAVLSVALGIGGNAAMFTIVSAVLIRPLPYPHADRLVRAANTGYYPPGGLVNLQQQSRTMDIAGYLPSVELNLTGQGEAWRVAGSSVSANLFTVLGAEAVLGRTFQTGDDQAGQDNLVILSHAMWHDKFGGDPGITGRVIMLGGVGRQVAGVMPPGFAFPETATKFWIPLHLDARDKNAYWALNFMPVIGRLRAGATVAQAGREIRSLSRSMVSLYPYPMGRDFNAEAGVIRLQQFMVSGIRTRLIVLQFAIGLVLLIACVNVASMLLARATSRQKEMAVRAALGASHGRIIRQLLTESVTLSLAGGALGIGLALAALSVLRLALPSGSADWSQVHLDWQVVGFVGMLSVLTGLAFGLVPALSASRQNLAGTIKTGSQRSAGTARARLRSALIMGEVAVAVVLSVSAGLLIRSLWMLSQVNPGFQPERLLSVRVSPNESLCRERATCIVLYNELLRRTKEIPGVYDVAAANALPLGGNVPYASVVVEGQPYVPAEHAVPLFWAGAVTPEYFRLMRIPIVAGRAFTQADGEQSARVIIVSANTAHHYWPGQSPIGKHIRAEFENTWREVVGVAANVRQFALADHSPEHIHGIMYMPYPQAVTNDRQVPAAMTLIVRTGADPAAVPGRVREQVRALNPNVPVSEIRSMVSLMNESTQQSRSMMWLFVVFAGVALVLAAIGAYGVVSYITAQRTFEIGMRVALGASRGSVFSLVLGQSLRLVLAGLVLGVGASIALTRGLTPFLYGTGTVDPLTLAAVCGVLVGVALLAGFVPARRAAALDPLTALRVE